MRLLRQILVNLTFSTEIFNQLYEKQGIYLILSEVFETKEKITALQTGFDKQCQILQHQNDTTNTLLTRLLKNSIAQYQLLEQIAKNQNQNTRHLEHTINRSTNKITKQTKEGYQKTQEEIKILSKKIEATLTVAPDKAAKEYTIISYMDKDALVGRNKILDTIHDNLQKDRAVLLVNGMGGIGKTAIARTYITRYQSYYNHLIWLTVLNNDAESIANTFINKKTSIYRTITRDCSNGRNGSTVTTDRD